MTIKISSLGGGGGLPRLAPDLLWPSRKFASTAAVVFERLTGIDGTTGGLVTVLSLTGKYAINYATFSANLINESITLKLTIDGVVEWNDTFVVGSTAFAVFVDERYECKSTFLLEITTITANNIQFDYVARPIL
jgi:hypothetical protein